jgi:hypothetical protein
MNKLAKLTSIFCIASAMAITAARGQTHVVVDEYGNGDYDANDISYLGLKPDPYNGNALGLCYELAIPWNISPFVMDIMLLNPTTGSPSDLLRFQRNSQVGNADTLLFFYSAMDADDPWTTPADVSVLPTPVNGYQTFTEAGLFGYPYAAAPGGNLPDYAVGPNGLVYLAAWGTPGNDGSFSGTEYTFISDIPEPGSFLLVSGGLGLLCGFKLLRRKAIS